MGCFSWIFSDTNKPLRIGSKGYLVCPDGKIIEDMSYNGYGDFNGNDVYELVALWNREFLANNPDYIIPYSQAKISSFWWYEIYSDLTISNEQLKKVAQEHAAAIEKPWCELRNIGIDIACYDQDNAKLPYPIKICQFKRNANYNNLRPSLGDPGQGFL